MNLKSKIKEILPTFTIIIFLFLIFFPTIFNEKTLFFRDVYVQDYPSISFVKESLKNFELPLWNPYIFSGFQQLGSIQPPLFYPFMFLYLFLPFGVALSLTLIIHYYLGGLGVYLLGRYLNFEKSYALMGAFIFALNGYLFELNNLQYLLYGIIWIPFIFLYAEKVLTFQNKKDSFLLLLFLTLQISTGRLDLLYFTGIMLASYIAYKTYNFSKKINQGEFSEMEIEKEKHNYIKGLFLIIINGIFSIGFLALQILPSFDYLQTTERIKGLDYNEIIRWSFNPAHFVLLFLNNFFGNAVSFYGFIPFVLTGKEVSFLIYNIYLSVPFIFLLFYSLKQKKNTIVFLFIAIFFMILSLGHLGILFDIFLKILPGFNILRYPIKLFSVSVFLFSLLTIYGFKELQNKKK